MISSSAEFVCRALTGHESVSLPFTQTNPASLSSPTPSQTPSHSHNQHTAVATVTHSSPFTPGVLVSLAQWHVRQKGILGSEFMAWTTTPSSLVLIKQSCGFQQTLADLNTILTLRRSKTNRTETLKAEWCLNGTDFHHSCIRLKSLFVYKKTQKQSWYTWNETRLICDEVKTVVGGF